MTVGDSLDWLPTGWTKHVKLCNSRRIKSYIEPLTKRKFYSKPEVLRYLERGGSTPKTNDTEDDDDLYALQKLEDDCSQCNENEKPDWLPRGWTMVLKPPKSSLLCSKKEKEQKFIIDPLTGWKFFATPTVISYLSGNRGRGKSELEKGADGSKTDIMTLKPRSSENLETMKENKSETENRNKNVYIERKNLDGLPPGWIKEIKVTRKSRGVRKDPYYTDPVSGYVFRSKKDALRYLETGDISQCAIIPKKRDELKWLTEETPVDEAEDINSTKLKDSPNQGTKVGKTVTSEQNEIFFDKDSREKIVVAQGTPNNLPPGWIKEIKIQIKENGIIRRDPYYTDPMSGYVFRSEKDVLRYLRTGDISICSIKPKMRDELEWLKGDTIQPTPATDICKSSPQTKKRGLFPDLPSRSSKRLSGLKSKCEESVDPVLNTSNLEEGDAATTEDSLQNQQGSKKSDDDDDDDVEYESNPVEDICSDPCIDFAYKTLTGSISMEIDSTVKSLLQEAGTSNLRKDGIRKMPKTGPNSTKDSLQGGKKHVP